MMNTMGIATRIKPVTKSLGELQVRRSLPDKRRQRVGPFIFFDHMGPAKFLPGTGVNVRAHPHIGLAQRARTSAHRAGDDYLSL
jgi:redox-sensitive bicupin YhaK (pirin superfamily)